MMKEKQAKIDVNVERLLFNDRPKAVLVLDDGSRYFGRAFGYYDESNSGEVVFQTGMVGYVESLTDPSYKGQILTLTYPLIGNYGLPAIDERDELGLAANFESACIHAAGLVISQLSKEFSHWTATQSLSSWMYDNKVPGIDGIDTRALTKKLRSAPGTVLGRIMLAEQWENLDSAPSFYDPNLENLNKMVCVASPQTYPVPHQFGKQLFHVVVVDCGLKFNQLRLLSRHGAKLTVVPCDYRLQTLVAGDADDTLKIGNDTDPVDGIFLSNGPGDPKMCADLIENLRSFLAENGNRSRPAPVFGICFGHQMMALAAGCDTAKMQYGNRGHNQPCELVGTTRCYITSQNHGYAVVSDSIPSSWTTLFENANDYSNEGIAHVDQPYFSVQFHPEHCAGPRDTEFLFDVFFDLITASRDDVRPFAVKQRIFERANATLRSELNASAAEMAENKPRKVLVLGSGGLCIGQAGEFDYSGSQALKAFKEEGIETVLMNSNIATVQTSKNMCGRVYFLPVTPHYVEEVIKNERPDGICLQFGGQTALNCGVSLYHSGTLEKYSVRVLGTTVESIDLSEDREKFADEMRKIGEQVAPSCSASSVEEARTMANKLGYPVLIRSAYALGGLSSGFCDSDAKLEQLAAQVLSHSPQIFIDKSLKGWKEIEYEVVRDVYGNCVTVCNMENFDPVGVHTGDSIVIAPSQTLNNEEYNVLRSVAIKVAHHLKIVGECNIQYAVDPLSRQYCIIEVNARLSRSSALASKATGYPLAYVAAKLSLGAVLCDLRNQVTGTTTACFEPSLDYCVVKIPRWDLKKFIRVSPLIGTCMKSVGEVMAIGRCFEEALQKAVRMVDDNVLGFVPTIFQELNEKQLEEPTYQRLFLLATAFEKGYTVERLHQLTKIDRWFLFALEKLVIFFEQVLTEQCKECLEKGPLLLAKQLGFSDRQIGAAIRSTAEVVRSRREKLQLQPSVKLIDTVAAEWPACTNYLYLSYNSDEHDISFAASAGPSDEVPAGGSTDEQQGAKQAVLTLGSGVYRIGSSVEFDCCAVGCAIELRKLGYQVIMLNYNPETVSTDYDICERLYFDEISVESVLDIGVLEQPLGVIVCMGGQVPNNIALDLQRSNKIRVLGTDAENIDRAENRYKFSRLLDQMKVLQPEWRKLVPKEGETGQQLLNDAKQFAAEVGYPVLLRPSYVLSGAAMSVLFSDAELENYMLQSGTFSTDRPVVVSKFIEKAKEIDVDAVGSNGVLVALAISEHIENAGVHSGDASLITPPQGLNEETIRQIAEVSRSVCENLQVTGPFNMQLLAKDNRLKVIECNLRASRSLPFVSKTLDFDFIALALRVIINPDAHSSLQFYICHEQTQRKYRPRRVGLKVPVFSFNRLMGADFVLNVEMASTGEVAGFGSNHYEAYMKALLSSGFRLPEKRILVSIGPHTAKSELLTLFRRLKRELPNLELYASPGTKDYYREQNIPMVTVEWPFEEDQPTSNGHGNGVGNAVPFNGSTALQDTTATSWKPAGPASFDSIAHMLRNGYIDLVINIPKRSASIKRSASYSTHGYKVRRMAVEHQVPLITDVKCAKVFISALCDLAGQLPAVEPQIDCVTGQSIVYLPGLIDVHVHLRDPGQTHKEDFESGTCAALAGGITTVLCMPNTWPPVVDAASLDYAKQLARQKCRCDYGLYVGASQHNSSQLPQLTDQAVGLKMYLNETFTTLKLPSLSDWTPHFSSWPADIPLCVHAEEHMISTVIFLAETYGRPVHICHVARRDEICLIRWAKERRLSVTCEVAPHHLFLNCEDDFGLQYSKTLAQVRPRLGTKADQQALWDNLDVIDCFATDHAPHTVAEKLGRPDAGGDGVHGLPGLPGLETMLPLLLTAVHQGRLTLDDIVDRLYHNPRRIFKLPEQAGTWVEVDLNEQWQVPVQGGSTFSRCRWTPYAGWQMRGRVKRVSLRNHIVLVDGNVTAPAGFGRDVRAIPVKLVSTGTDEKFTGSAPTSGHMGSVPNSPVRGSRRTSSRISDGANVFQDGSSAATNNTTGLAPTANQGRHTSTSGLLPIPTTTLPTPTTTGHRAAAVDNWFYGRSLVRSVELNRDHLHRLFNLAQTMKQAVKTGRDLTGVLRGRQIGTLFFEPSTRTQMSFTGAAYRLGATVLNYLEALSSSKKGESLSDTLRTIAGYVDTLVIRHPQAGFFRNLPNIGKPIISAGDGSGEHPTQALLDVFTIREEIGTVNGLTVCMVGDLKNSRTVHSLVRLLSLYKIKELRYVSLPGLEMPTEIADHARERAASFGHELQQKRFDSLQKAIRGTDVLYFTRLQRERLSAEQQANVEQGFVLTPDTLASAKEKMIVMHPLPRNDEIHTDVDVDQRAAYFRQAENGLYVRMALLTLVLTRADAVQTSA